MDDYESQLEQIAAEVDSYIVNTDGSLEHFKEQIKPLAQRWETYRKVVDKRKKELLEHWELVKKTPKLQDKNVRPHNTSWEWDRHYLGSPDLLDSNPINEMPAKYAPAVMAKIEKYLEEEEDRKQGYPENSSNYRIHQSTIAKHRQNLEDIHSEFDELSPAEKKNAWIKTPPKTVPNGTSYKFTWWRYINLEEENVFGCWRPPLTPLPEDPIKILKPAELEYHINQTRKELPDARNLQEEYERYYIFLSSVHDNYLQGVGKITEGVWSDTLSIAVLCCLDKGHGDKTAFLKAALGRVCQSNHKTDTRTEQETGGGGDTYKFINSQVSFGDEAQHADRDINITIPEPEKARGVWGWIKKFRLILVTVVAFLSIISIGIQIWNSYRENDSITSPKQSVLPKPSGSSVDVNGVVFDTQPTAYEIIAEIERLPAFEQKAAAENYKGRTFKWSLRFDYLVVEEDGMVYVACEISSLRGEVSFNINANAKENLKIKKIKKGEFLDVSGEISGITLVLEPRIRLKDVRLEFFDLEADDD